MTGRCPRCLEAHVYKGGLDMHTACPSCGLVFEREPGYFIGSMYISYGLASVFLVALTALGWLLLPESIDIAWIMGGAIVLFLPLVPATARTSRILWLYMDHWFWPEPQHEQDDSASR